MRLGFLTACLPDLALDEIVRWAGQNAFPALEVAAWPADDPRAETAAHVDVRHLDARQARALRSAFADAGVVASSLAFYVNMLDGDPAVRRTNSDHLRACLDAAAAMEVPSVGTFVGRDVSRSVRDNLDMAPEMFAPMIEHARQCGVEIVIENCPMSGWHPDGYPANLAYSPELWTWMSGLGLKLNYDPSHLPALGIDPVRALQPHVSLVSHVQAKDIEVLPGRIDNCGFYGNAVDRSNPWDHAWWRYRLPGEGSVDWAGVVATLRAGGYDGVVSIEHEDPLSNDSTDMVKQGLLRARDALAPLLDTEHGEPPARSPRPGQKARSA